MKTEKRVYRITDNGVDERAPYALVDPESTVVAVAARVSDLASLAFDHHNADEVRHDYSWILHCERAP